MFFEKTLLESRLNKVITECHKIKNFEVSGVVTRAIGLTIEGKGFNAPVGTMCYLRPKTGEPIEAIVTGFVDNKIFLMPTHQTRGLELGDKIYSTGQPMFVKVGDSLLGRIIDGAGLPLDGMPLPKSLEDKALYSETLNPLTRGDIDKPLDVGVKAINGLLTIGQGQRIGLFAGSGVGKSVLLGMLAKYTKAEVVVVGLIGERGREVKDFIDNNLGKEGLKKSVVVACPADYSPVMRLQGASVAMSIAEYFRDQGKHVLLLMDSLTRFAQAQREIGLAMGEPPATKGYPPSVFAKLPELVERAGMGTTNQGSITGLFTVLAEGDDVNDPVVDASRAILDGHILLSRKLADQGHYPAIDIEGSVSRVMQHVTSDEHREKSIRFKKFYSLYQENKDLINIGAYVPGANPELDFAVEHIKAFNDFLQQKVTESFDFNDTLSWLEQSLEAKPKAIQEMQAK